MSKIKYITFFKKDAVFDSERIVGELLDVCEQIDLGEGGTICRMQAVQGELVHCKDRKYWQTSKIKGGEGYHTCMCVRFGKEGIIAFADDFCSRGVKR